MASAVVGQLLIELSANVARLQSDMDEAKGAVKQAGIIDLEEATSLHYEKGADLKITDGPFAGQDAICIQSVIDRVRVAISLLGYQHVVSIPVEHLARAL